MDVCIIGTGVAVVGQAVAQPAIGNPVIIEFWKPLGIGIKRLKVAFCEDGESLILFLANGIDGGLLIEARVIESLVILLKEVAVREVPELCLKPEIFVEWSIVSQKTLHMAGCVSATHVVINRHFATLISTVARSGRAVRDHGRASTENVSSLIPNRPPISISVI